MIEIGALCPPEEILKNLKRKEPILYGDNGFRARRPRDVLKTIEKKLSLLGITRVAEISQLAFYKFPVFQSSRPNIWTHTDTGQNSGSQGKGSRKDQAKISCIMESVETYCCEPKQMNLIRGSYQYLRHQHTVLNPRRLKLAKSVKKIRLTEPLMWTEAVSLEQECRVLIPAEYVYFPFFPKDYETRSLFPQSSNGMAAGSTYLEATIHGLYEVIERQFYAAWEAGIAKAEALYENQMAHFDVGAFYKKTGHEYEFQLYALTLPGLRNLPMIHCYLVGDKQTFAGYGCSCNLNIAMTRAISEALQSMATIFSGTRESLIFDDNYATANARSIRKNLPEYRTLSLRQYKSRIHDKTFQDLRSELDFLIKWAHRAGFRDILVSNLTRKGLNIPVVKVIVPGTANMKETWSGPCRLSTSQIIKKRFGFTHE